MIISAIAAVSNNNAIGVDNDLPWHLPADLKFFKQTTKGFCVIMGRKSFESIGRPLPGRTNVVITRQKNFSHSGVYVVNSVSEAIRWAQDRQLEEVFIIGGSTIYEQTKELWNQLYLTHVDTVIDKATAFFPDLNLEHWNCKNLGSLKADEANAYDMEFKLYHKLSSQ